MSKDSGDEPRPDPRNRKDAIQFFLDWLKDENAQPYCALLGEYGMGKTTTCKALSKELLDRREQGEQVPLPIYFDLRDVGETAKTGPALEEILELAGRADPKTPSCRPRK